MVDREITLTYDELLARDLVERDITLTCVSNEVGGPYIGNARWTGTSIQALLEEAGVQDGADAVLSTSVDGMTIGTPIEALTDGRDAIIAVAMNGEPLPADRVDSRRAWSFPACTATSRRPSGWSTWR